jgi:hypothetical protein
MPVAYHPPTAIIGEFVGMAVEQAAASASTACNSSALAPLRNTSVSGSVNVPGWQSWKTLVSVTAYHSFGGEAGASNTPTIRRLNPSCRHQLSRIAPGALAYPAVQLFMERAAAGGYDAALMALNVLAYN